MMLRRVDLRSNMGKGAATGRVEGVVVRAQ